MWWIDAIRDWVWLVGAISPFMVGAAMLWLKSQFATLSELRTSLADVQAQNEQRRAETDQRLTHLERTASGLPDRSDLDDISDRLSAVERATAVTAEAVRGSKEILGRVDHTVNLLLQNKLAEERSK